MPWPCVRERAIVQVGDDGCHAPRYLQARISAIISARISEHISANISAHIRRISPREISPRNLGDYLGEYLGRRVSRGEPQSSCTYTKDQLMTLADDAPHRRLLYVDSTRDTSRSVSNSIPD